MISQLGKRIDQFGTIPRHLRFVSIFAEDSKNPAFGESFAEIIRQEATKLHLIWLTRKKWCKSSWFRKINVCFFFLFWFFVVMLTLFGKKSEDCSKEKQKLWWQDRSLDSISLKTILELLKQPVRCQVVIAGPPSLTSHENEKVFFKSSQDNIYLKRRL